MSDKAPQTDRKRNEESSKREAEIAKREAEYKKEVEERKKEERQQARESLKAYLAEEFRKVEKSIENSKQNYTSYLSPCKAFKN